MWKYSVGSSSTYDAHRDVPLGVHTCYQTVSTRALSEPMTLLLLRVVGYHEITRMLPVGNLQVEVVSGEHPIGFRRHEPCGVDAERAHHSFQLVVGLVLVGTLERRMSEAILSSCMRMLNTWSYGLPRKESTCGISEYSPVMVSGSTSLPSLSHTSSGRYVSASLCGSL